MRFLLAFIFCFLSVFAIAQAPPMKVGGPQGIDVTRSLNRDWISIPIYVDTPAAPLTGAGWPGAGYLIQASKNYREATVEEWLNWVEGTGGTGGLTQLDSIRWQDEFGTVYFLPQGIDTSQILDYLLYGDTSVWHYTGKKWRRVGGNAEFYFNYLLDGGEITQVSPASSRQFIVAQAEYYISGIRYKYDTAFKLQAPPKAADSTGRIDVITISTTGPRLIRGQASRTPYKPRVPSNEIELSTIYFRPFDTIPTVIGGSGGSAVTSIYRIPGKDSLFYTVDTLTFKIKDSIGIATASNGLTATSGNVKLGGALTENTSISLAGARIDMVSGSDTTRFFPSTKLSIGGTPDSTFMLNVNGPAIVKGILRTTVSSLNNASVIMNGNTISASEPSLIWGSNGLNLPSNVGIRNVVISPAGAYSSLTGTDNTIIGRGAGVSNSSGTSNVLIGGDAGNGITNGSRNTIIGGTLNAVSPNYTRTIQLISGGYENNRPDSSLAGLTERFAFIGGGDDGQVQNQPDYINDFYFGGGHRIRLARFGDVNFYAPSAQVRTDSVGANFSINAGRGTGAGLGGSVIFRTSPATTSGTTLQTLTERARITPNGNMLIGTTTDSIWRLDVNGQARVQTSIQLNRNGNEAAIIYSNNNVNYAQVRGLGTSGISISEPTGGAVWRFYNTGFGFGSGDAVARQIGKWNVSGTISGPLQYPAIFAQNQNLENDSSSVETIRVQAQLSGQMRNGYGSSITFYARDADTIDNRLADVSAIRLNSDNTGGLAFGVQNAGSRLEASRITNNGNLLLGTTTDSTYRLYVRGGARADSLVVDSIYAKFGRYTTQAGVTYNPIQFRNVGSKTTIDLRPSGGGEWNANWYGAITHNGTETDFLGSNYGSMYIGSASWEGGTRLIVGGSRANPAIDIKNSRNILIGTTADSTFKLDVNGRVRVRDTMTLSTSPVSSDTTANDLLVISSSNGQVRRYTGDWFQVPLSGSAELNFPSTNGSNKSDLTITVNGAADGDVVSLGVPNSVNLNHSCFTAWVSNTNEVTVRFSNYGTGALDPVSATFKVKVFK